MLGVVVITVSNVNQPLQGALLVLCVAGIVVSGLGVSALRYCNAQGTTGIPRRRPLGVADVCHSRSCRRGKPINPFGSFCVPGIPVAFISSRASIQHSACWTLMC